ncbi:hypothetical protein EVAR_22096_1 [Eumeta japonica]|uniref:Uncharacterized protein n=1 Tax=Eumeta variegata TaxID=151549 RepID=A0A4C1USN3_EUMVA|nr:hypothetical protein EVAR_22096_1 [Eumeta japonica]
MVGSLSASGRRALGQATFWGSALFYVAIFGIKLKGNSRNSRGWIRQHGVPKLWSCSQKKVVEVIKLPALKIKDKNRVVLGSGSILKNRIIIISRRVEVPGNRPD